MDIIYEAKSISKIDNGKGYWDFEIIGIFEVSKGQSSITGEEVTFNKKIGEYKRNYSTFYNTFCPFKRGDRWYALYSREYMYTRIMSLPDCKDLGGEDDSNVEYKNHFCPTDYYIPILCGMSYDPTNDPRPMLPNHNYKKWCRGGIYPDAKNASDHFSAEEILEYQKEYEKAHEAYNEWLERHPIVTTYADFGFVSGCAWGDDSSWKIQFLDLSEAHKGIIKRDSRFGYIEMPDGVYRLQNIIDCDYIDNLHKGSKEKKLVNIGCSILFDLETGEADQTSLEYITKQKTQES